MLRLSFRAMGSPCEVRLEGVVKGRRLTSASGGCGPSCRLGGMGNEGVGVAGLEGVMDENRGIGLDPLQLGQSAGVQIDSDTDRECSLGSTPQQLMPEGDFITGDDEQSAYFGSR